MATPNTHTDPYVRERSVEVRDSNSGPMMLIGIILAVAIAIGAWFAFNDNGSDAPVVENNNTEQVVPGDTSGDTTGDTSGDTGTTDGTTTTP